MKKLIISLLLALCLVGSLSGIASAHGQRPHSNCSSGTFIESATLWSGEYTTPDNHFFVYQKMQELDFDEVINGITYRRTCAAQVVLKVDSLKSYGLYIHYFLGEIDDANGILQGGQMQWSGPGGTGDSYLAPGASSWWYGPWYWGLQSGVTYKPFVWVSEGYTGNDSGGGWGYSRTWT